MLSPIKISFKHIFAGYAAMRLNIECRTVFITDDTCTRFVHQSDRQVNMLQNISLFYW